MTLQSHVGRKVEVCFNHDTSKKQNGVIVRDDLQAPFLTIIKLDSGNYVLSYECQCRLLP